MSSLIHLQPLRCGLLALFALLFAPLASAHSGSTAYLQVTTVEAQLQLRWDLALRDLDDLLQLDADQDGQLTWGEVQQAEQRIHDYALPLLHIASEGGPCPLAGKSPLQIAEHAGEPYASLAYTLTCKAVPQSLQLDYQALFDQDASHRGLLRLTWQGKEESAIFAPERRKLAFGANAEGSGQSSVFGQYFKEGLLHVWTGYDHLLFLAGLFLAAALVRRNGSWQPAENLRQTLLHAAKLVTAFTIAHAITLCLAALGVISLPTRLVESAVAATVLFAGLNNLVVMVPAQRIFALCWLFGLIHGTAIAGALLELGLPAKGRVTALLGFNLGVEVAQLALVALLVPAAFALRRWGGYVRWVLWPGSLLVAVAGLLWLLDRAFALEWPLPI